MLLPALNSAREKARRISCASNQKQIGLAFQLYVNYPDDTVLPVYGKTGSSEGLSGLTFGGVLTDLKMFVCPSTITKPGIYADQYVLASTVLDYHYIPGLNASRTTSDSAILFDAAHGSGNTDAATDNHDKFGNMLYGDGHVGSNIGTGKGLYIGGGAKHGWYSAPDGIKPDGVTSSGITAVSTSTTGAAIAVD